MADINERLEKQMEGTNLALAAVAEVLQKMDGRLAKEEASKEEEEIEKAEALAKAELVKSIAKEVQAVLKASEGDSYAGSDASGDEKKAAPTGGTPQNADDSESDAGIDSKIEEQQNTIQAMKKADDDDEEMEKGHDDDDKEEKGMYKDDDDEDAADEPVEEKGMDDEDDSDEMKSMKKQLETLKKQLEATETNISKAVQTESEARLRKMGFREETGLQAPKVVNSLGVDDSTPIQKAAATADTAGQLAELSYSELRRMQHNIETGNTDGVPRELLG
jgi:hypothetical protein|tara:strand:- start:1001 stop:1831 length:831 start_codon:yes stop_codon:yes gene_type:complete